SGDQPPTKRRVQRGGADLELASQAISHGTCRASDGVDVAGEAQRAEASLNFSSLVGKDPVQSHVTDVIECLTPGAQRVECPFELHRVVERGDRKAQCLMIGHDRLCPATWSLCPLPGLRLVSIDWTLSRHRERGPDGSCVAGRRTGGSGADQDGYIGGGEHHGPGYRGALPRGPPR